MAKTRDTRHLRAGRRPAHLTAKEEVVEDKLIMILQLKEQFEAINIPLQARRASLMLVYDDHFPKVFIKTANSEPEVIAMMNTRTKKVGMVKPKNEDNRICAEHIIDKLKALDCTLLLSYDIDPKSQRKRVKLQLGSQFARTVRHTLWWCWKGESSPWLEGFNAPEHL